ncbi:MAG: VOC family protein, partial [Anaerolineales bacterium]
MTSIRRINHVAIVVEDIDAALKFWSDGLGLDVAHVEDVPDQESVVAFLPTGQSEVELVKPTSEDSGIARFLKRRGPGMHHICFEVDDIDSCIAHLK